MLRPVLSTAKDLRAILCRSNAPSGRRFASVSITQNAAHEIDPLIAALPPYTFTIVGTQYEGPLSCGLASSDVAIGLLGNHGCADCAFPFVVSLAITHPLAIGDPRRVNISKQRRQTRQNERRERNVPRGSSNQSNSIVFATNKP